MGRAAVAFALVIVAARLAEAQHSLGPERRDIQDFAGDIWSVLLSAVHADHRDVAPVAATFVAVGLTSRVDSTIWVWMTSHDRTAIMRLFEPIREGAKLNIYEMGSGQYLLPLSAALYTAGRLSRSADLRDAGLGCAAGHLSSLGLRMVAYTGLSRGRPRITPSPHRLSVPGSTDWFHQSFFSGHIANSMACASFLSHRYSLGVVEPLAFAYSAAIGIGRMADGEHWASDTMTGAVVGFAIGKAIADRQLKRMTSAPATTSSARRSGPRIPVLSWSFAF